MPMPNDRSSPAWPWLSRAGLDLYLSSCQLGVTLASLGLGAITEPAVAGILDPLLRPLHLANYDIHAIGFTLAMVISTSLHIVIGEQAPKNWASNFSNRMLPALAVPLVAFTYVFYPLIWLLNAITKGVLRMTGVKTSLRTDGGLPHTEEELRVLLAQWVAQERSAKARAASSPARSRLAS